MVKRMKTSVKTYAGLKTTDVQVLEEKAPHGSGSLFLPFKDLQPFIKEEKALFLKF